MTMLDEMLGGSGGTLSQLAEQFGIDPQKARDVMGQLVPALSSGMSNHTATNGVDSLLGLLQLQAVSSVIDDPTQWRQPEAKAAGNGILGEIFGTKDISRQVADHTSETTGIGSDVVKKILPIAAVLFMGYLQKHHRQSQQQAPLENQPGTIERLLTRGQDSQKGFASQILGLLT